MAKKTVENDRRARLEQVRREQASAERRRTVLLVGAVGVVIVILIGLVAAAILSYRSENDITELGVPAAQADCQDVVVEATTGASEHVGPGTSTPDTTRVDYGTVPPTSGPHFAQPDYPTQGFYTAQDRPAMESLVHNLEHGYTVLWYSPDLPDEQVEVLRDIRRLGATQDAAAGKFIVSAWDDSYGELPDGATVALSHWGAEQGYRQLCGAVSGEAVATFIADHPASDSPEPAGA